MIGEEVIKAESTEELKEIKLWLFQENMRLKQERSELEQERTELEQARNKFLDERVKLRDELDELNRRTIMERKRLKEENLFFEKKMAILQEGFRQAEEDRKKFEQERQILIEGSQRTAGHRAGYRRRQFYSGTAFIPGESIIHWLYGRDTGI